MGARVHQRADQHAVEGLDPNFLVEADLGELRQTIGVIGIGLVGRHVERLGGVTRIDAMAASPSAVSA